MDKSTLPDEGPNPMVKEERGYRSYLLRLWQIKYGEELVWRASLESPHTGERLGFSSLDDLCHFLREETATSSSGQRKGERFETGPQPDDSGQGSEGRCG